MSCPVSQRYEIRQKKRGKEEKQNDGQVSHSCLEIGIFNKEEYKMTKSSEKREMCYPTNYTLRVGEFGLKRLYHPAVLILVVMEDSEGQNE